MQRQTQIQMQIRIQMQTQIQIQIQKSSCAHYLVGQLNPVISSPEVSWRIGGDWKPIFSLTKHWRMGTHYIRTHISFHTNTLTHYRMETHYISSHKHWIVYTSVTIHYNLRSLCDTKFQLTQTRGHTKNALHWWQKLKSDCSTQKLKVQVYMYKGYT